MARERRHEDGYLAQGRWRPDERARLTIRRYVRARLIQACTAREVSRQADARMGTTQSKGLVEYWEHICAFLAQDWERRGHSVDAPTYAQACTDVITDAAVLGSQAGEQQTIPGME